MSTLESKDSGDTPFQPVDTLPEELIPTSFQVLKFSGKYLTIGGGDSGPSFDWPGFKSAVDNYRGDDLTLDKYDQSRINQKEQSVGAMVDKVSQFLHDAFSASIDTTQLSAVILNTFTHLREESSSGFLQFSSDTTKHNSSWEYRVLFAVPFSSGVPNYFYSLVTTIKITADIREQTGWWGLSSSTTKNFGVVIDAMQLVVVKGFRSPV
ncbi:hypothetical protein AX16_006376 [Volvariella volvacea WC 439]|nr:hypothetical protein AX16_006376 [Volvariella volvacea WC 439]